MARSRSMAAAEVIRALPFAAYHGLQRDIYGLHFVHARNPEVRNVHEMVRRTAGPPGSSQARAKIDARIARLRQGNHGDAKLLKGTGGVYELRVGQGPGYRVYLAQRGTTLAILLCGGDKRTQDADVERASEMAKEWKG